MTIIGQPIHRIDARGKVIGETLYPGDINMPDQAYMKILFAGRPHAIIRSIDTSQADALPGVIATFTAKDVPVNEYGLIYNDQPVLCGPGSSKPYTDRVRFIGDQVALVVADTEDIAAKGRDLIKVEYEDLPVITDMVKAMQKDAVLLASRSRSVISSVITAFAKEMWRMRLQKRTSSSKENIILRPRNTHIYSLKQGWDILTKKVGLPFK